MDQDEEKRPDTTESGEATKPKKPPQREIERMNRILIAAAEAGKTPHELADEVFRKMFE